MKDSLTFQLQQLFLIQEIFLLMATPEEEQVLAAISSLSDDGGTVLNEPAEGSEPSARSHHDDRYCSTAWQPELGVPAHKHRNLVLILF